MANKPPDQHIDQDYNNSFLDLAGAAYAAQPGTIDRTALPSPDTPATANF